MEPKSDIVLFQLEAGISGERGCRILADVSAWPGIDQAGPLHPGSPVESLRRSCVATLAPGASSAPILDRLRVLREVEWASDPTARRLVA